MLPVRSLTAVAMVAVLACATPAWAATAPVANREAAVALPGPQAGAAPAPTSPPPAAHDDAFPWIALAPLGLATGYVWTGRWERVVLVPLGTYVLVLAGAWMGIASGIENMSWNKPVESLFGLLLSPIAGAGLAFGGATAFALVDQAVLPHPGGPWLAPAVTTGTLVGLVVLTAWDASRSRRTPASPR